MSDSKQAKGLSPLNISLALLALVAITVVVMGLITRQADSQNVAQWTTEQLTPTVAAMHPSSKVTEQIIQLPARLEAKRQASIYSRVDGYVKHWAFDIGSQIKQGEVLVELDIPDIEQQILQATANLEKAQAEVILAESSAKRWKNLAATQAVAMQDVEQRNSEYQAALALVNAEKANVKRLLVQQSLAKIIAPFDGTITARNIEIGDLVNAGSSSDIPMFTLAQTQQLQLNVEVPQKYTAYIKVGMQAQLLVPETPDKLYTVQVARLSSVVSADSGGMVVQLTLDNQQSDLLSGGYAQITLALPSNDKVMIIPASALIFNAQGLSVAVIDANNKVLLKNVLIGRDLGREIEVTSGLELSQRIIVNPPDGVNTGDEVRVVDTNQQSE